MSVRHLLMLKNPEFRETIRSFFRQLEKDELLQQAFIENPAQSAVVKLLPKELRVFSSRNISDANRLLFSVLANDGFRQWLTDYQAKLHENLKKDPASFDRAQITRDLAAAFTEHGDPAILTALIGQTSPLRKADDDDVVVKLPPDDLYRVHQVFVVTCLYLVALAVVTPAVVTIGLVVALQTESDKEIAPPQLRSVAERLIENAKMLAERGDLTNLDKDLS